MTFSLAQLSGIGIGYLSLLFFIAWITDKGFLPPRLVKHPIVYVLSLGVYASAWAIYGAVGFADEQGYNFLAFYLGLSGIFLLAPILLMPILRLVRQYQLSSLADLFAFRYRSGLVGALTTITMLCGVMPLLVLQIQAVADSTAVLTNETSRNNLAFWFCLIISLFAILFGARHITPREKHEGMVMAIAAESLIKLIAMVSISIFALVTVFDSPTGLQTWLSAEPDMLKKMYEPLKDNSWHSLILAFFVSAVVMPHMFHMGFTENLNPRALLSASWGVPTFLLIMSAGIPILLWAGLEMGLDLPSTYFPLGIAIAQNSPTMAMIVYIGGLSAASGIIIVSTLAMAGMVLNHLVLPVFAPKQTQNLYRWLLWARRILILAIICFSYIYYYILGSRNTLTELGMLSFVATMQFVPGLLGALFWPRANRAGFIAGLTASFFVWVSALFLPTVTFIESISIPMLNIHYTPTPDNWHTAAIASIIINGLVFIIVSIITPIRESEQRSAEACAIDSLRRPYRWELTAKSIPEFIDAVSEPLGQATAQREVTLALRDLSLHYDETRPYALRRLRDQIETNLSGLLGPALAYDIVDEYLPYNTQESSSEDIQFIEHRLEEYKDRLSGLAGELDSLRRFHRQTLYDLPMGVLSLSAENEILSWNRIMEDISGISSERVLGSSLDGINEPWKTLLLEFSTDREIKTQQKKVELNNKEHWLSLLKSDVNQVSAFQRPGGQVIVIDDDTDFRALEDKLAHSERLASIGRLAAGVAHEIGNPVTGIACLAQNLKYELDDKVAIDATAGKILEQTRRVDRIMQSLVNFSHSGSGKNTPLDPVVLHHAANEAIDLLQLNRDTKQVLFKNMIAPKFRVAGDSQRLLQVFINLLSNARDASEKGDTIEIDAHINAEIITIDVTDSGEGIQANVLDTIFEPFVTTKDPGKGTGLGLALVYSIIEDHYGEISASSPPRGKDKGTRFSITLPEYKVADVNTEQ